MSLLHRIAISKGNTVRQATANRVITGMERNVIAKWNKNLQAELYAKAGGGLSGRLLATRLSSYKTGQVR
jgi:hypothetical protein